MPKAEQAIENDKLHLVSPVAADHAERDQEHPQANEQPLASAARTSDDDIWKPNNPDVVMFGQPALAMYLNSQRQVVIRQEQMWNEDDDSYIFVAVENIDRIIDRLQALKDDAKALA